MSEDNITVENLTSAMTGADSANNSESSNKEESKNAQEPDPSSKTTAPTSSWLDSLPDDLKGNKSLSKFTDQSSLVKSYLELEKNRDRGLLMPSDDASDEEWDKMYKKLGMPEDRKYISSEKRAEFIKDELADEDSLTAYEELFANSGLTKRQSEKALKQIMANTAQARKNYTEGAEQETAANIAKINEKYGKDATEKINILQATMAKHGSKELVSLVKENSYSPALVDILIKLGEADKSDSLVAGEKQERVRSKESAKKEIKGLESDDKFMLKYKDKKHVGHDGAVERMQELYDIAYNE